MQRYQCHKIVEAAKILAIERLDDGSVQLELDDHEIIQKAGQWQPGLLPARVGRRLTGAGLGYFVRYADGYESWSPTTAFEAGYTLVALVGFTSDQLRELKAIATADPGTVEEIHNRWFHQQVTDGWHFGNTDTDARMSSYLRVFHELAPGQQALLVHELAEVAEEEALEGPARMEPARRVR